MARRSRGAARVSGPVRGTARRVWRGMEEEEGEDSDGETGGGRGTTPACVKACPALTINNGDVGVY